MKKDEWKAAVITGLSSSFAFIFVVLLYFFLQNLGNILAIFNTFSRILRPFVVGCVIAYLLRLPCNFIEEKFGWHFTNKQLKLFNRAVTVAVFALLILAIYVLSSIIIPDLIKSANQIITALPTTAQEVLKWARNAFPDNPQLQGTVNTMITTAETNLKSWISGDVMPLLQGALGSITSVFTSVAGMIYDIIIGFIVCVYLLIGRRKLARHGKSIIYAVLKPNHADFLLRELKHIDGIFSGFFGGKLLDSLIIGLVCYLFCFILNLIRPFPNAILVSVIVGISNIIPYFGPIIGGIISALLIMMNDPVNTLIFIIFILVLQQIDGNILGPHILSSSVGLPGIWVLFSITLFGGLFGFVGIVVGVPVFSVIYDAVRRLTCRGLRKHQRMNVLLGPDLPPSQCKVP